MEELNKIDITPAIEAQMGKMMVQTIQMNETIKAQAAEIEDLKAKLQEVQGLTEG